MNARELDPVLARYLADPTKDAEFRSTRRIPEDRYYTVSVWPVPGVVTLRPERREVRTPKISKSTQTTE